MVPERLKKIGGKKSSYLHFFFLSLSFGGPFKKIIQNSIIFIQRLILNPFDTTLHFFQKPKNM